MVHRDGRSRNLSPASDNARGDISHGLEPDLNELQGHGHEAHEGLARCFLVKPDKELSNMRIVASVLFGAAALTGAALMTVPSEAQGDIAVQIGPGGVSIGVDQYRDYCRDYGYRHRYYDNCNRYRFDDAYYSDRGEDYRWQQEHRDNRSGYNNAYGNDTDRSGWSDDQWRQWCQYNKREHGLCDRWNRD